MILIADSGSTKTQWMVVKPDGVVSDFITRGLNPYHFSGEDEFGRVLQEEINEKIISSSITKVFFYGAGCAHEQMNRMVQSSLSAIFTNAEVNVHSDILGAARALFGNGSGLVLILGTGANVGLYSGLNVKHITPSLGYILGDEGSGAHLGKMLLKSWLYGELPSNLRNKLEQFCPLTLSEILMKVYSDSGSAMFLSSFTRFLADNIYEQAIIDIVENSFTDLWNNHIGRYSNINELPIGAVGSIASTFSNQLKQVFGKHGCVIQNIIQYPIERLASYHSIQNL